MTSKALVKLISKTTLVYTNDLHDALLRKNGVEFWKCWRANKCDNNECDVT